MILIRNRSIKTSLEGLSDHSSKISSGPTLDLDGSVMAQQKQLFLWNEITPITRVTDHEIDPLIVSWTVTVP